MPERGSEPQIDTCTYCKGFASLADGEGGKKFCPRCGGTGREPAIEPQIESRPCSCRCGGSWAWVKRRRSGAYEMIGCVCHTPTADLVLILEASDG